MEEKRYWNGQLESIDKSIGDVRLKSWRHWVKILMMPDDARYLSAWVKTHLAVPLAEYTAHRRYKQNNVGCSIGKPRLSDVMNKYFGDESPSESNRQTRDDLSKLDIWSRAVSRILHTIDRNEHGEQPWPRFIPQIQETEQLRAVVGYQFLLVIVSFGIARSSLIVY